MLMMTSQILISVYVTKTQKSRYFENETLFFIQIQKIVNYTSRATLLQKNSFVVEVTHIACFTYIRKNNLIRP